MISREVIQSHLGRCVDEVILKGIEDRYSRGKVRDIYDLGSKRLLISTDRQSAFDVVLGLIPFKGQVLNRTSAWWFDKTQDVVVNHLIAVPDANASLVRNLEIFPVEVVVRAYITGSTDTSAWMNYERGVRDFCGVRLPEGLRKNQRFDAPILTPTTKSKTGHDEKISPKEILASGLVSQADWDWIEAAAMSLFDRGCAIAAERGLILVDTKYEFGVSQEGVRMLADEVHTPDSSRYWIADSFEPRFAAGQEPESLDKEFLRLWLKERGMGDASVPKLDDSIRVDVSIKYMELYERLTGDEFRPETNDVDPVLRIAENVRSYMTE